MLNDLAEPVWNLAQSLEDEVHEIMTFESGELLPDIHLDAVAPQAWSNASDIAINIFFRHMDSKSKHTAGTAITVTNSNKSHLVNYLFNLDLLRLSEVTINPLYELVLARTMSDFSSLSRQIQGLRYTIFGNFALTDWSYSISEGHRNLKDTKLYFIQLKRMIQKKKKKNPYRKEWQRTAHWMRKTLKTKEIKANVRPLTTIITGAIMFKELPMSLLYAKLNAAIVTLRYFSERSKKLSPFRVAAKYIVIPLIKTGMKTSAKVFGGFLKVLHKVAAKIDRGISKVGTALKPPISWCKYHFMNWSHQIHRNIY